MTTTKKKVMFSLSENLVHELDEMAKELKQTKSKLTSEALEFYFDYLDLQIAQNRIKEKNKRYSLKQVHEILKNEL